MHLSRSHSHAPHSTLPMSLASASCSCCLLSCKKRPKPCSCAVRNSADRVRPTAKAFRNLRSVSSVGSTLQDMTTFSGVCAPPDLCEELQPLQSTRHPPPKCTCSAFPSSQVSTLSFRALRGSHGAAVNRMVLVLLCLVFFFLITFCCCLK